MVPLMLTSGGKGGWRKRGHGSGTGAPDPQDVRPANAAFRTHTSNLNTLIVNNPLIQCEMKRSHHVSFRIRDQNRFMTKVKEVIQV